MSEVIEILSAIAPSVSPYVIKLYEKMKNKDKDEVTRITNLALIAIIAEQNNNVLNLIRTMDKKLDNANEALAVLLKRTEK